MKNKLAKGFSLVAAAVCLVVGVASSAEAQWKRFSQPSQKFLRLSGHGFSDGYHRRTPGPRSDYYNPYSFQNTHRIADRYDLSGPEVFGRSDHFLPLPPVGFDQQQQIREDLVLEDLPPIPPVSDSEGRTVIDRIDRRFAPPRPPRPRPLPVPPSNPWPFKIN